MAINKEIRAALPENAMVFDNPSFDNSIIGISTECRVVYSYSKMPEELMNDEGWRDIDCIDWIEYNTIRALSYMGEYAPIICEDLLI